LDKVFIEKDLNKKRPLSKNSLKNEFFVDQNRKNSINISKNPRAN